MCGLFGVIRPRGVSLADAAMLDAIGDQLRHRGPDGSGFIREGQALLGMHRLSIMDPSHGWQPFWSEDKTIGVLGNGEIYNAGQLREQLTSLGHRLGTHSDIEVVPHLFEHFGTAAFGRLRGMFALIVLDRRSGQVFVARDRLGEKPISYFERDGVIYLASEQTALVRAAAVPATIDTSMVSRYLLHGFTPEPMSLIADVKKVPAAHILQIELQTGTCSLERYWDSRDFVSDASLSTEKLAAAIEDAVVATCTSDVPVGIALSGGLDSSIVAAIASRARTDLHAFTIGYSASGSDESSYAQEFAAHLGIPCHTTVLETHAVARGFAEICGIRDEPISDIAGPALAAVPRAARQAGVPVLLTGIGGDELFWGYDWIRHLASWTTDYLGETRGINRSKRLNFTPRPSTRQGLVDWALAFGGLRTDRELRRFVQAGTSNGLMPLPFFEFQPGHSRLQRAITELCGSSPRTPEFLVEPEPDWMAARYTWATAETYLRVNNLAQIDRLAMHYSIESRTPLADSNLLETIMSSRLGSDDHVRTPKARLREVAAMLLPQQVVDRPKRGFTPPVREWIRAIWAENAHALNADACIAMADIRAPAARRMMRSPIDAAGRVDQVSLRLLTLELWLRSIA